MADCVHHEVIDGDGLGICKKCGQERQYNREFPLAAPVIVKEGGEMSTYARTAEGISKALAMAKDRPELSLKEISKLCNVGVSTLSYQARKNNIRHGQNPAVKRSHRWLSPKETNRIVRYIRENPSESIETVGVRFGRSKSTIHGICVSHGLDRTKRLESKPAADQSAVKVDQNVDPRGNGQLPSGLVAEVITMIPQRGSPWDDFAGFKRLLNAAIDFEYKV